MPAGGTMNDEKQLKCHTCGDSPQVPFEPESYFGICGNCDALILKNMILPGVLKPSFFLRVILFFIPTETILDHDEKVLTHYKHYQGKVYVLKQERFDDLGGGNV